MKTKIVLLSILLLAGCGRQYETPLSKASGDKPRITTVIGKTSNSVIERFHDDEMNATCWIIDGFRQFQCIPDTLLVKHKGISQ